MKNLIKIIRDKKNFIEINWKLTNWCNYHCEYCNTSWNLNPWIEQEKIKLIADKLNKIIDYYNKDVNLTLVGGEVTYYNLEEIIKNHLTSSNLKMIYIISNLSKPLEYFQNLVNFCSKRGIKLRIRASLHLTQIPDLDIFIDKVVKLQCVLNIVLNSANYKDVYNFLYKVKTNNINIRKIDLLFDRNEHDRLNEVKEVYNYYMDNIYKKENAFHELIYSDKSIEYVNRAQLAERNLDFRGYNCTGILRIDINGNITGGACKSHWNINKNINELNVTNLNELIEKLTVKCSQRYCPLCTFIKIERILNEIYD